MAVSKGGLYLANWVSLLKADIVVDLDLTTPKMALHTNSLAPAFDTDTAWSNTAEVSIIDANYATGGKTVSTPVPSVVSASVMKFTSDNFVWTTATISSAVCGLYYMDALAGNNLIFLTYFGGAFTSTAGTFTVTVPGAGWWTITNP